MKANILVYDVGSTYTKGAAFPLATETDVPCPRQHPTTLENISDGARGAEAEIRAKGVEFAPDMVRFSSCSAAGGLRMVAMGFMPRVTAKAAKEVAMTAGARVMEVVSADEPPEFREEVLREIKPDIILLSGGTDGGDMANVLENADIICKVHGRRHGHSRLQQVRPARGGRRNSAPRALTASACRISCRRSTS